MGTDRIGQYEKVRALVANERLLVVGGIRAGAASQLTFFDHLNTKLLARTPVASHVLALTLAGERVVAGCADGSVRSFSTAGGDERVVAAKAHSGAVHALAIHPDGDRVVSVGADGRVVAHSLKSSTRLAEWSGSSQALRAVAIDPQGEKVAVAGDDGVVRSFDLSGGSRREMPGHTGAVFALGFTPRDGRLASSGDDGVVRFWYLVGAVDVEMRSSADGHEGAILALHFPPTPPAAPGEEPIDRVYTAGADGKIKSWRLDKKIKPKGIDCSSKALGAMAFAPPATGDSATRPLGTLFAAGDDRRTYAVAIGRDGTPGEKPRAALLHGFDEQAAALNAPAKPRREAAVKELAAIEEPEALELALKALASDKDPDVRALAATELATNGRRGARAALRDRLSDDQYSARTAAFQALQVLDREQPLVPLRAALKSKWADVRIRALRELPPLRESSPLVPGLLASGLTDADPAVGLAALDELQKIYPGRDEAVRIAFARGPAPLKVEGLIRAAFTGWSSGASLRPVVARALDDADANVRRLAFAVRALQRRPLAAALEKRDEDFARTVKEIARRGAQLRMPAPALTAPATPGGQAKPPPGPTDAEIQAARDAIPGEGTASADALDELDREPLLAAMACRTADTALRGARGLAQLGDPRALGALLQLSREAEAPIRKDAALALKELSDPRGRARLVWMLDDPDANVRNAALEALGKLAAPAALTVAEEALHSAFEDVRVRGLDRLVKATQAASKPAEAEALLGDALEDEASKVRDEAFRTLWSWHAAEPQKALDRAIAGRFPDLRLRAVKELEAKGKEPWAQERLQSEISDRDASVALAAYDAQVKLKGAGGPEAHLAAIASSHPRVRAAGTKGAVDAPAEAMRSALVKLIEDDELEVRTLAVESLAKLFPNESGPLIAALGSSKLDVRVRAAEFLAVRRDENLIGSMRSLLTDPDLPKMYAPAYLVPLRQRAAAALATLGSQRMLKFLATELLKSDDALIREQAARGLATGSRRGDEGYLLDALGHADVPVRSWAADGLARLGDSRALPVLVGTLRHDHLPIRTGAILSFAALGLEGTAGLLHGLEDPTREIQELVFAIVLSRDLAAFRAGNPPELLVTALSSGRPDVRYAAARALELRIDSAAYLGHLVDTLHPPKPEKAGDMKDWPSEEERERLLVGLASALSGHLPEQRYAAAQVLLQRAKPLDYFREAGRVGRLASVDAPWVPDTSPRPLERPAADGAAPPKAKNFLRRLFASFTETGPKSEAVEKAAAEDTGHLRRLAFGAYLGLLRQVVAGDDEGHRVRRDAVDRVVALTLAEQASHEAGTAALLRALDDPHHLVRKAALAGLKAIFPPGSDEPQAMALAATSADAGKQALDELGARGADARPRLVAALDSPIAEVRKHAFDWLEKTAPAGSLEPLLAALSSAHADLRIGVIERLASSNDPRVTAALSKAMESEHEDLRLRAAELLAGRADDRCIDVLAAFLRHEDSAPLRTRALTALARLGSEAAVKALAARIEESTDLPERLALAKAIGETRHPSALTVLATRFDDLEATAGLAAFNAALELVGRDRTKRDAAGAMKFLPAASRSKNPAIRLAAANELDFGDDTSANELLAALFGDRDPSVRQAAVAKYAKRVIEKNAPLAPLEAILAAGSRELMLSAAEGVAEKRAVSSLRPLLLFARAGEPGERERALVSLGALGDARALPELETVASGGTEDAPAEPSMQAAAHEGLGRLQPQLKDPDAQKRVLERLEQASIDAASATRVSSLVGLRYIGGERARVRLEAALADPSAGAEVAQVAARELGKLGDTEAEGALAKALDSGHKPVRDEARKALDALFPKERTRVEFLAVDAKQVDISEPAAAYLAKEGDPKLLVPRLATLKTPALRQRLAFGLARRDALPVVEVCALLSHALPEARALAATLIGARMGSTSVLPIDPAVLTALEAAERALAGRYATLDPTQRAVEALTWRRLLWAASLAGTPNVTKTAQALLGSLEASVPSGVRLEAARTLTRRGKPGADAEALAKALADVDPAVREAAARGLAKIAADRAGKDALAVKPFDPVAFGPVAASVVRGSDLASRSARQIALPSLAAAHDAKPVVALLGSAKDEALRLEALAALGRVGGNEAVAALQELAFKKSEPESLRKAAYRALKRAQRQQSRRGSPAAAGRAP